MLYISLLIVQVTNPNMVILERFVHKHENWENINDWQSWMGMEYSIQASVWGATSPIRVPDQVPATPFPVWLPTNPLGDSRGLLTHVRSSLPSMWEMPMELWFSGFSLTRPWLARAFGMGQCVENLFHLSLFVSLLFK